MLLKLLFTTILLQLYPSEVKNANIFFASISLAPSHQIVFQAIYKELSLKGHKVHAITPNPLNDFRLVNLTEIDVSSMYFMNNTIHLNDNLLYQYCKRPDFLTTFRKVNKLGEVFSQVHHIAFEHANVQKFLKQDHQFDVCIVEWLFPTLAGFAAKYDCPLIGITSTGAPIVSLDTLGNPSHPAYAPDHNLAVGRDMTFKERLISTLYSIYVRIHYHLFILPTEDKSIKKYLGENLPYLGDIEKNISLLLLNRNLAFHRVIPTVPTIIQMGGLQLSRKSEKLSKQLKQYLDNSRNGAIYFSFGSSNLTILFKENIKKVFFETFAKLPYNILWKWDMDEMPGKPPNVFIQKWFPQIEVLKHPNIKLFLLSGGQQSLEDAINNHVPILGFPGLSDQTHNVDTCRKYGMGLWIDLEEVTVETLNYSIYEIISNPKYKENAAKLDKLMRDQPHDGIEEAIWWIEYVIRHKGTKHLRSPAVDMSWFQYLLLDVIGFIFIIIFLITFLLYKLSKLIFKIFYYIISQSFIKRFIDEDKKIK